MGSNRNVPDGQAPEEDAPGDVLERESVSQVAAFRWRRACDERVNLQEAGILLRPLAVLCPRVAIHPVLYTVATGIAAIDRYPDLGTSLEQGRTLPASWYTDPTVLQRERDRIFHCTWQYAGLLEQAAEPGQFFTYQTGDIPIIVLRDRQGELRAFVNVCRHRGSELVLDTCGKRNALQCHYHAWTYDLDGSLRAAPGARDEAGFDKACYSLLPVQVDVWGPLIFVNPDLDAPPLAVFLGELPQLLTDTGLNFTGIRRRVRDIYEIAANWKVVVDNYLECYHCPVAHPSFSDLIDVNDYTVTEYEWFSAQGGPLRASAREGRKSPYAVSGGVEDGFYAFLWPTFTINVYPGPGNVSLNLFQPIDEHHTRAVYEYCFVDDVADGEVEEFVRFIDQVQQEDVVLCESVQRGLRSGRLEQGQLMLSRENGLRHFQRLVYRSLA